jgi:hypothetical protein
LNCFTCPSGESLPLKNIAKNGRRVYQSDIGECVIYLYYGRCHQSKIGQVRSIKIDNKEGVRQKMKVHMGQQGVSREIYKKAKSDCGASL